MIEARLPETIERKYARPIEAERRDETAQGRHSVEKDNTVAARSSKALIVVRKRIHDILENMAKRLVGIHHKGQLIAVDVAIEPHCSPSLSSRAIVSPESTKPLDSLALSKTDFFESLALSETATEERLEEDSLRRASMEDSVIGTAFT